MRRSWLAVLAMTSMAGIASAQPTTKSLDEVLRVAGQRAPDLAIAEKASEAAGRRARAARRQRLPSLSVDSNINL